MKPLPLETGAQVAVVFLPLKFRACCCALGDVVRGSDRALSASECRG